MLTTEQVVETVSRLTESFHVVDSNEAAAALGAELEALLTSTMLTLAAEHRLANANFGRAIEDLFDALR